MFEPVDMNGQGLVVGSRVRLVLAPDELVSGLPKSDQAAIRGVVGVELSISGFDEHGHAELMFYDTNARIHFIWVRPSALALA